MSAVRAIEDALAESILEAADEGAKCLPLGANSKAQRESSEAYRPLSTLALSGIRAYEPTELVLTAGAGTRLADIDARLASEGQMLGFEAFKGGDATLGGAVACGIAGPARAFRGAVRDFVLGVEVLNGRAERLRFGGQVIKNVAGYDVSRLFAGSWGTLGMMLSVSLRVLPSAEAQIGLALECEVDDALARMCSLARVPCPLSGAAYVDGILHLRLAGFSSSVDAARRRIGGSVVGVELGPWVNLANANHAFFASTVPIYRLVVPPATPHLPIDGEWLIDWGGALRWLATEVSSSDWMGSVVAQGGRALPWPPRRLAWLRSGDAGIDGLQTRIREAFDPHSVFA